MTLTALTITIVEITSSLRMDFKLSSHGYVRCFQVPARRRRAYRSSDPLSLNPKEMSWRKCHVFTFTPPQSKNLQNLTIPAFGAFPLMLTSPERSCADRGSLLIQSA